MTQDFTQSIYVGSLDDQKLDKLRVIKHRSAVQWCHLLDVGAEQTDSLLDGLQLKHQLDNLDCALSTVGK
jgi:hypothetical protein